MVFSSQNIEEYVLIKFCKWILGVNYDKASNLGATIELGKYPSIILVKMIKFWDHMRSTKRHILRAALQTNINLDESEMIWK